MLTITTAHCGSIWKYGKASSNTLFSVGAGRFVGVVTRSVSSNGPTLPDIQCHRCLGPVRQAAHTVEGERQVGCGRETVF